MKRNDLINLVAALSLALPPLLGTLAAEQFEDTPAALEEATVHAFGDRDKTCLAWTDSCRSCQRAENGDAVCSNIGIACQPKAIVCTRSEEPPKPAAAPKQDGAPK